MFEKKIFLKKSVKKFLEKEKFVSNLLRIKIFEKKVKKNWREKIGEKNLFFSNPSHS